MSVSGSGSVILLRATCGSSMLIRLIYQDDECRAVLRRTLIYRHRIYLCTYVLCSFGCNRNVLRI